MLSPLFQVRNFDVKDVYPFNVNITWEKEGAPATSQLFGAVEKDGVNVLQSYPCVKSVAFMKTEPFLVSAAYAEDSPVPPVRFKILQTALGMCANGSACIETVSRPLALGKFGTCLSLPSALTSSNERVLAIMYEMNINMHSVFDSRQRRIVNADGLHAELVGHRQLCSNRLIRGAEWRLQSLHKARLRERPGVLHCSNTLPLVASYV
jgi:hypothetical protein